MSPWFIRAILAPINIDISLQQCVISCTEQREENQSSEWVSVDFVACLSSLFFPFIVSSKELRPHKCVKRFALFYATTSLLLHSSRISIHIYFHAILFFPLCKTYLLKFTHIINEYLPTIINESKYYNLLRKYFENLWCSRIESQILYILCIVFTNWDKLVKTNFLINGYICKLF